MESRKEFYVFQYDKDSLTVQNYAGRKDMLSLN